MSKTLTIVDKDYTQWVLQLSRRYRQSQIKAAVRVNSTMLEFYWSLGADIEKLHAEAKWGAKFLQSLSADLRRALPDARCFSTTNLLYMKNFYRLYHRAIEIAPQLGEHLDDTADGKERAIAPQVGEQIKRDIMATPWGHHKLLIDKFSSDPRKALFYVRQTVENGWSRDVLLNFIGTDLYERSGKALTNFTRTLPEATSELAQELAKDNHLQYIQKEISPSHVPAQQLTFVVRTYFTP